VLSLSFSASSYCQEQNLSSTSAAWGTKVTTAKLIDKMNFYNDADFKAEDVKPGQEVFYDPPPGQVWLVVWVEFTQPKGASTLLLKDILAIDDTAERYPLAAVDCEVPVEEPLRFLFVYPSTMNSPGVALEKYKKRGAWNGLFLVDNGELKQTGLTCTFEANPKKQVLTILSGESIDDRSLTLERQGGFIIAKSFPAGDIKKLDPTSDVSASLENQRANVVLLFLVKRAATSFELQAGTSPRVPIPPATVARLHP
jgi:hypothetical protein